MELVKKEIETSVLRTVKHVQVTLDKDMNVPDTRPDVEKMIQNKGEVKLTEVEVMNDRIRVRGILSYRGLYLTAEAGPVLHSLASPFELEEYINVDGITASDMVRVTAELDDLNVILIHSRKLGIRALITFHAHVDETRRVSGAVHGKGEQTEELKKEITLSKMAFQKKDTCRVKGEMTLSASKPNIRELIWEEASLRNPEVRLMDGKVQIRGEILVFFLYLGEEEHVPVQHIEWEVPFTAEADCMECREGMVGNVHVECGSCQLEVKPDLDGEERTISMETVLTLDMKGFQEEKMAFLQDIYQAGHDMETKMEPFSYENLIVKNNAKTRVSKRIRIDSSRQRILQLIHVDGSVKIDETEIQDNGILVEGVLLADLLMITDDDRNPLLGISEVIPFSYVVEAKNLQEKDKFEMEASLDQIHGTMLDGDEMEIKGVISLDTIAFSVGEGSVLTEAKAVPYSYEKMKSIPGIAVYLADKEESLWNVAKAYGVSMEEVRRMNQLEGDRIRAGQKIMIVKKVKELAF